jgi:hypothetical protein
LALSAGAEERGFSPWGMPPCTLPLKVGISIPAPVANPNDPVEKIAPKSGKFSRRKNVVSKHHIYHAIHHNFTTKKPWSANRFSQKPLQKHHSATAKNYGRYFAGISFAGDSESQKMFTTSTGPHP